MLIFVFFLTHICFTDTYASTLGSWKKDLENSEKRFLISGLKNEEIDRNNHGAITLCFKRKKKDVFSYNDHTSLVFEYQGNGKKIQVRMSRYGKIDECCGDIPKNGVHLEGEAKVIPKVYRGLEKGILGGEKLVPPTYVKYATWVVDRNKILMCLEKINREKGDSLSRMNCVKYTKRNMRLCGLNINFLFNNANTLRSAVVEENKNWKIKPKFIKQEKDYDDPPIGKLEVVEKK